MKSQIIKINSESEIGEAIEIASEALNNGQLVAFPTETVYGIGARADIPVAINELYRVKQRPNDKPFTLHIGKLSDVDIYVPDISAVHKNLLKKAWPGPLTAIFELNSTQLEQIRAKFDPELIKNLYYGNTIGLRLPSDKVARELLKAADGPVSASSANPAGRPNPCDGSAVIEQLDGQFEILLDSGPTKIRKASTIIKLKGDDLEIIRPGIIDERMLNVMKTINILIVCTGNTCRSPMAQGIFATKIAEKLGCGIDQLTNKGYKLISAGVMAWPDCPATPEAVQACAQMDVDICSHRATVLTPELINKADYIFALANSHARSIIEFAPEASDKVSLLGNDSIADPIGGTAECYQACANEIAQAIDMQLQNKKLI
ncbi:MAG: threonylcarbamoyl-AMP synthase [Phycisphaerae bacterium]|nr:threonylcarbamoyl-AMP synthase [Phycisphaerae bacterium]